MATYDLLSDVATDQAAARDNSAALIKDGTKLTGNVQALTARYVTTQEYSNGDVLNITLGCLPKGVRVLPGLSSMQTTVTSAFGIDVFEALGTITIIDGDQTGVNPSAMGDSQMLTTEVCEIKATFTLGATLLTASEFIFTIGYAANS